MVQVFDLCSVNARIVQEFYETAFNKHKPAQAWEKYVDKLFQLHNPCTRDGPEALISFVGSFVKTYPRVHVEIKKIMAEGDFVAVYGRMKLEPTDHGSVVMDIYRVENGKILERWDIL
jgi:predicted SnoaL-like aldol condensation-catalyzing enzyme